jgi:hypothetical protein
MIGQLRLDEVAVGDANDRYKYRGGAATHLVKVGGTSETRRHVLGIAPGQISNGHPGIRDSLANQAGIGDIVQLQSIDDIPEDMTHSLFAFGRLASRFV